jgi:Domain of Unknown Function (DUF1080)
VRPVFVAAMALCCFAASKDDQEFNGRWDITANGLSAPHGWWLEVSGAGTDNLKGKFLGSPMGLLDELPKLSVSEGELRFALEARFRKDHPMEKGLYWARLDDGKLKGTFEIEGDPSSYLEWIGVRAPALPDHDDGTWKRGDPVTLFNGRDLTGWEAQGPGHPGGWTVKDGVLTAQPGATDLVSNKKFFNFILDAEYRMEPHSNSGIGLRGRYEIQLTDDVDRPRSNRATGSILGRIAPTLNAERQPGEWQMLVGRLVGREVTVILNGIRVINRQSIDGPTAIALDSNEAEPGPILLQGSHGAVEFRRIVIYPLSKKP